MDVPMIVLICFVFYSGTVGIVYGQSKLIEPPSRSSMWRYGFPTPRNTLDNRLNCGGINVMKANNGKCGMCGDSWSHLPRPNENTGQYNTGIISRNYTQGQVVPFTVEFFIGHKGHFEFRLCEVATGMQDAIQDCLDSHRLTLANGSTDIPIESSRFKDVTFNLVLPDNVTCERCVVQWTYITAHMWGCNGPRNCCFGCGLQERYVNCADVRIKPAPLTTTTKTTTAYPTTTEVTTINPTTTKVTTIIPNTENTATTVPTAATTTDSIQELLDAQRKQLDTLAKLKAEMAKLQTFHSQHDSVPEPVTKTPITNTATTTRPVTMQPPGEPDNLKEFVQAFISVSQKYNGDVQSPSALMNILQNVKLFEPTTPAPVPDAHQFLESMFFPNHWQQQQPKTPPTPPVHHNFRPPQQLNPMQGQYPPQYTRGNIHSNIPFQGQPLRQHPFLTQNVSPYNAIPTGLQESPMMPAMEAGGAMAELFGLAESPTAQPSMFNMDAMTGVNPDMSLSGIGGGGGGGAGNMLEMGMNNMLMDQLKQMMMQQPQSAQNTMFQPFNMPTQMSLTPVTPSVPISPVAKPTPTALTLDTISDAQRSEILDKLKVANTIMSKQVPPVAFNEKLKVYRRVINAQLKIINDELEQSLVPPPTTITAPAQMPAPVQTSPVLSYTEITQNHQLLAQQKQISDLRQELEQIRNMTINIPQIPPLRPPSHPQQYPQFTPRVQNTPMTEVQLLDSLFGTGSMSGAPPAGGNSAHPLHTSPVDFNNLDPFTLMGGMPGMGGLATNPFASMMNAALRCDFVGVGEIEWPCMMYCRAQATTCVPKRMYPHFSKRCATECAVVA